MKNILSKTRNKFYPLFVIIISALTALSSCDKNDDTFFNEIPDIDNPFEILPDPEGTIQLSMRDDDNGKTLLDNIYISDENFASNYVWSGNPVTFVSLGNMSGLANVKQIPTAGWASKVAVVPGNGYIVYDSSKDTYYRLYVTGYIVSTTGGIIGADVKYQVPFYGKDEAILPETESLTFPANGGMQTVVFKNQEVIPFDIETDVSWCSVQKASTNDNSFLANAIAITVEGSSDTEAATGKITLKTKYGKETVINITRSGEEPFITLNPESSFIAATATGATKQISFESNIEQDDLTVTSSAAWCKAVFSKVFVLNTETDLETNSNEIKFIGDKPVSEIDENLSLYANLTKYLSVTVEENSSTRIREATITIRDKNDISVTISVAQEGTRIIFSQEQYQYTATAQEKRISFSCDIDVSNINVTCSSEWCNVSFNKMKYIDISLDENISTKSRNAVIYFKNKNNELLSQIEIVQEGAKITFNQEQYQYTATSQEESINFSCNINVANINVTCSSEWCDVSLGKTNYIDISLDENISTKSRNAVIYFKNKNNELLSQIEIVQEGAKITFNQNQYQYTATPQEGSINFSCNIDVANINVTCSSEWCNASFGKTNYINISLDENISTNSRNAIIYFRNKNNELLSQIEIVQEGAYLKAYSTNISFDRKSHYQTTNINTTRSEWEAESSESWCTLSQNGNSLTIRVTASTADRTAVISFKGFSEQITVRQSKYAVGDSYNENGIEGTVAYMSGNIRYIYRDLGEAVWSTEFVPIGAGNSDDGEYNMEVIKRIPNWQELYPAFYLCDQLNTNGVSGWYLPAINELKIIKEYGAWSSTEYGVTSAYYYDRYHDYSGVNVDKVLYSQKSNQLRVYAVHKF